MRIAYFVHDLNDAAVVRRVRMLVEGGHGVDLVGFRRSTSWPAQVEGARTYDLGRTADGRLAARAGLVLRHALAPAKLRRIAVHADVLIGRNLEALVLAARVRLPGQRLVYECLDIHRLLLGRGLATRLLHGVEGWAMRGLDQLVVSAPAFRDAYFRERRGYAGPTLLLENKVPGGRAVQALPLPPGGVAGRPWVIGWFGMLRCRRTLACLADIARGSGGAVEICIAGKPSLAEFPDFAGVVAGMPGVRYMGPYAPEDLPRLYARAHFIWAIDWFEDGLNSRWLLPNRLYEGLAHGAVPIALAEVATGAWLTARGLGLVLDEPSVELPKLLADMTPSQFQTLRAAVRSMPQSDVVMGREEAAAALMAMLGAEAHARSDLALGHDDDPPSAFSFPARPAPVASPETAKEVVR